MKKTNENQDFYLSQEELAQLKGGVGIIEIGDDNKNSAYKCKCDNKEESSKSNLNKASLCVCECTPGAFPQPSNTGPIHTSICSLG